MISSLQPAAEYRDYLVRYWECGASYSGPKLTYVQFCAALDRWEREYQPAWNIGDAKTMQLLEESLLLSGGDRKEPVKLPQNVRMIEYVTIFAPHIEVRDIIDDVWRQVLQGVSADKIAEMNPENTAEVYALALILEDFRDMYCDVDAAAQMLLQRPGHADFLDHLPPQTVP